MPKNYSIQTYLQILSLLLSDIRQLEKLLIENSIGEFQAVVLREIGLDYKDGSYEESSIGNFHLSGFHCMDRNARLFI